MKIAIVGPTHPYKGGIPLHTTSLAHQLKAAGHDVTIVGWKHQFPFFYPGQQFVPEGKPEMPLFEGSKRVLSWRNPAGWVRWARKLRSYDEVIFVWLVPTIQGPVALSMMKALGKKGPRKVILCHNVIQHSAGPIDKQLARRVLNAADLVLTHTEAQARLARKFTNTPVRVAAMISHLPGNANAANHPAKLQHRLIFFGLVRKYKGVDVLLRALALIPEIQLTIAGEIWGSQKQILEKLITELQLGDRVRVFPQYVPAHTIPALFNSADALVLPYRSATATNNVELGFANGVPVIATAVGSMPSQIQSGINGLLCEPDNVDSLSAAIQKLYEPGVFEKLRANLPKESDNTPQWQAYIEALTNQ